MADRQQRQERQQGDATAGTDDVQGRQQAGRSAQQSPDNQGDGMDGAPTDGGETDAMSAGTMEGMTDDVTDDVTDGRTGRPSGRESGRDASDQSAREGRGGYGNDTGFSGGTVGSRDDVSPYRDDDRGTGGMH